MKCVSAWSRRRRAGFAAGAASRRMKVARTSASWRVALRPTSFLLSKRERSGRALGS